MAAGLIWYFAYGSNMNLTRLVEERLGPRGLSLSARVCGRLDGWRLAFNKPARAPVGAGAGNIVPSTDEQVYGTLNAMPEAGLAVLDHHEGVRGGHYERRTVPVLRVDTGETVEAIAYVALLIGDSLRPTRAYLGHLLAGRDVLPAGYCAQLATTPTLD